MLAIVLVLTTIPPTVQVGRAAIEHTCFLISQKLLEDEVGLINPSWNLSISLNYSKISLTAAQCSKTLIVASSTCNSLLRQCTRLLVPALVEFIGRVAPSVHDGSINEPQAIAITEIWKAFSTFFASVAEDKRKSEPMSV